MNKIIITGSTGHIGNNLVRFIINNYPDVYIKLLVRNPNDISIKDFNCEKVVGDITDENYLTQEIEKDSIVIHSAGFIDVTNKQKEKVDKINNIASRKLVDICIKKQVKKFIYISSVDAIYKDKKGKITEPDQLYPELLDSVYGKSKALATNYILDKIKNGEITGTVIYPSAVIGPYDYKVSSVGQALVDNIHNRLMARMKGGYNFIDVRDLACVIGYICFNEVGYSYLVTGENMTIDEMFLVIKNKLNKKRLPIKLPLWLVKFIACFAPIYYKVRKVKPVFTRFALKTLNTNYNYDNTLAKKELKLNNRPAKESLEDAIDWFINNGY